MSLILDALRRSEEERNEQTEPMATVYHVPLKFERPSSTGLWLLLAVVLLGFAAIVAWLLHEPEGAEQADGVRAVADVAPARPAELVPAPIEPSPPLAAQIPVPVAVVAPAPPGEPPIPVIKPEPPARHSIPRSLEEEARLAMRPPVKPMAEPLREAPRVEAVKSVPVPPPAKVVAAPAAAKRMSELPDAIRSRLEQFELNTHFFSSVPGKSFALVSMRKYREGDTLEGTSYRIGAITAEGIVIDYGEGNVLFGMTRE